jgi:hypothetical protein
MQHETEQQYIDRLQTWMPKFGFNIARAHKIDLWQEIIETVKAWIGDRKDTSVGEVLEGALGIAPQEQTMPMRIRVARILVTLKFVKYRSRTGGRGGVRKNRYWRPNL